MSTRAIRAVHAAFVSIELNVEAPDVQAIGQQMRAINAEAKMHGYNWDAFINRYLAVNIPVLLGGLQRDPEENIYVALYDNDENGNLKAKKLEEILNALVANPAVIYAFLREEGDGVEWH